MGIAHSHRRDSAYDSKDACMVMNSNAQSPGSMAGSQQQPLKHSIDLKTLVAVLIQAEQGQRAWIGDFADEHVLVSADLFQIIQAARLFGRAA
jgi:hypothetical protein